MSSRSQLGNIGAETVSITQRGDYVSPSGKVVSIADATQLAIEQTTLITPDQTRSLRSRAHSILASRSFKTRIGIENESTLAAAKRLVEQYGPDRVAALNFASAKNPGGGFLGGARVGHFGCYGGRNRSRPGSAVTIAPASNSAP